MGITRDLANVAATGDFGGSTGGGGSAFSSINFNLPKEFIYDKTVNNQGKINLDFLPDPRTLVLIHSETDSESTDIANSIIDSIHGVVNTGSVTHSTVTSKFGNSSLKFGTDKSIDITNSDQIDFNQDWTFEAFSYLISTANQGYLSNAFNSTGISLGYFNNGLPITNFGF